MYSPKYTLTSSLLTHITSIERLYGQIEALKLPKKLELNLNRDNLIQSSYASNKIEGNPLTLPEVTNLLLDDRIPANRDEKEVVNYFEVLKILPEYKERRLTTALVEELHAKIFAGVHDGAGSIRDERVVVGKYTGETGGNVSFKVKHDPPYHTRELIEATLEQLLLWIEAETELPAVIRTGAFHHEFVYIHPFEDGNGRVCRILSALLFIKAGYEINKYFVLDDYYDIDRSLYSDKLHSADEGDKTTWLEYFSEGVMYSLQSALARAEAAMRRLSFADRPTKKEAEVINILTERPEVTSTEVAEILTVSRQQAHNLLRSLVEKGLVSRKGTTKSSYYFLK